MVHLPPLIIDLTLILTAAGVTSLLFKKIKQPLVLGYILAGILVGPYFSFFPTVTDGNSIQVWAEIGVIFLLFSLGLEFSFKKLAKVGGSASITAIVEVVFMLLFGYITGQVLGWSAMDSIFLGGILSISSTTIIIRAFDELGVKTHKFAGLVFGVLIVEDLVAILLLVLLSTLAVSQQFSGEEMFSSMLKLGFFMVLWFIAGIFLVPSFLNRVRKILTEETVLIISLALCLLMVYFSTSVGFSPALGAFVMGSILAETTFGEKIEHLLMSVKNLFGAVFFVSVGMMIDPNVLVEYALPIAVIAVVTILGKIISTSAGALLSGQTLKHSIQTGMSLAQIGEFSFIIASLGLTLKVTESFLYPIAVAVSAITTFTTPFLIKASSLVYSWLEKILPEHWLYNLNKYSSTTEAITTTSDWKELIRSHFSNMIIHAVVISTIVIFSTKFLTPFYYSFFKSGSSYIPLVISLILVAPFIWAMSIRRIRPESHAHLWENTKFSKGPLIAIDVLRVIVGIGFSVFIITHFISGWVEALIVSVVAGFTIIFFSKNLRDFYAKIESRFMRNLQDKELNDEKELVPKIVPWDGHLAELTVSPKSSIAGKTLVQLELREKYGVNLALINRQGVKIPVPDKNERIYPADKLFIIGSDEQLDSLKQIVEVEQEFQVEVLSNNNLTLKKVVINEDSPLLSLTIRSSGIKEKTKSLIVGIERDGKRILNPDSTMSFEIGDIVWVAGNPKTISECF